MTVADEVRARYARGGVTKTQLADEYGVHQTTVSRWTNEHSRRQNLRQNERRRRRQRQAFERQKRDQADRTAGGGISEAYSLIRKTAQLLDTIGRDGANPEIRAAADRALGNLHVAEDEIVRALGVA